MLDITIENNINSKIYKYIILTSNRYKNYLTLRHFDVYQTSKYRFGRYKVQNTSSKTLAQTKEIPKKHNIMEYSHFWGFHLSIYKNTQNHRLFTKFNERGLSASYPCVTHKRSATKFGVKIWQP